jgi:MFS family permease
MTGSSAVGMVLEGMLCSRFGCRRVLPAVVVGYAVGYLMLSSAGLAYPALVLMACGSGSITTLMPVMVRQVFGGRDYAAIWSVVITYSSVASFLATPVWGMVYDMFGSYAPALFTMPVLLGVSLLCLKKIFR